MSENDETSDANVEDPNDSRRGRPDRRQDDDWDDWDDDADWGRGPRGDGPDMKLIAVIVLAVAAIVATILFTRNDKNEQADRDEPTQPTDQGGFCDDWQASLGGNGKNVSENGVYVWSDFDGVHVRAVSDEPVTVKVVGSASYKVKSPGDGVKASANEGKDITFEFPAGTKSGPDLDTSCEVATLSVDASTAAGPLAAEQIKVGDTGTAEANPAQFRRE